MPGDIGGIGRGRTALRTPETGEILMGDIGSPGGLDDVSLAATGPVGDVGGDQGSEEPVRLNVDRRGDVNRKGSTTGSGGSGIGGESSDANVARVAVSGGIPNVTRRLMRCEFDAERDLSEPREPPLPVVAELPVRECSEYELDDVDLRRTRRFLPGGGGGNIGTGGIGGVAVVPEGPCCCCCCCCEVDASNALPGNGVCVRETLKSASSKPRGETGRSSSFGVGSGAGDIDSISDCGFKTGLSREGGCARGVGTRGGEGSRG